MTENIELSPAVVTANTQEIHILMIGGGRGASALMEVFPRYNWLHLNAIADIHQEAIAFPLARTLGITCYTDVEKALSEFEGDLAIDVTGDPSMSSHLRTWSIQSNIEVISGKSAKLLFDMSRHQITDLKTIHMQNAHMFLLDNLLNISMELSHKTSLDSIAEKMLEGVSNSVTTIKGLAIMLDDTDKTSEIVGAIGLKKPTSLPTPLLQDLCATMTPDIHFKVLSEPLQVGTLSEEKESFNVVLPFWQEEILSGILLFSIQDKIDPEQEHMLDTASLHLRIITTTMDQYQKLEHQAAIDPLTGVCNRRTFEKILQQEVMRCQRNKQGHLSCAFLDMDAFKKINDNYGHQIGDEALKHVVTCIRHCIRAADTIGRYGGDEFVLLLPSDRSDDIAHVYHIGERIIEWLATNPVPACPDIHVSASIGIATQSPSTADAETIIKQADEAAYHAKRTGSGHMKCVTNV